MTPGPRCGRVIAKDLAIAGKNAAAELRLGEAVEGASAATLLLTLGEDRSVQIQSGAAHAPSTAIRRSPSPARFRDAGEESLLASGAAVGAYCRPQIGRRNPWRGSIVGS